MTESDLKNTINESGFPLQFGIANLVRASGGKWDVVLEEHPWRDMSSGDEKFLDLAIETGSSEVLVIECKRAKDTDWLFIRQPAGTISNSRLNTRAWIISRRPDRPPRVNWWSDIAPLPASPIADFCVIRKGGQRSQELIERTAAEIVRATEAIAAQDLFVQEKPGVRIRRIYVPVIVTTARLHICDVDRSKIDFLSGEATDVTSTPVGMIRFSKSLSAPVGYDKLTNLKEIAEQNERSVLVVQASYFAEFLQEWQIGELGSMAQELWGV